MQEADQEEVGVVEVVILEVQSTTVQALQKKAAVILGVQTKVALADIATQVVLTKKAQAALAIVVRAAVTVAQKN